MQLFLGVVLNLGIGQKNGVSLGLGFSLRRCLGLGLILGKSLGAGEGLLNDKKSKRSNHLCCLEPPPEMFVVQPMGSLRFKIRKLESLSHPQRFW